ncbi:ATP-binding cassette domain-containing protein [Cohnella sp. AR92]|uniref:ATP-binding cassette domain-containing protein n=1 Tax=Cohnella sp. AR92 TaxID=648716 RepID=UPI000F8E3099|nr:ATP-binding cassette domain-containing protein [Cohnella sp. AR92]RUS42837.1 ATP-binding cassette domain-containing protein [Cohnella sp. AR92]
MTKPRRGTAVDLKQIGIRFGDKQVLSQVDLSIEEGEFVAIVGRSGCGKSTLLRLIAGLEEPTEGSVWRGESSNGRPSEDTRVLFQESRLLPWKSILDNVRIGARGDRKLAEEALRHVGLADRGREWPAVLSGGQKQRVALARALASGPRLLLLDEPLGALDALTRIEMQQLIEQLWLEEGFTVLLVTHDVSEAVALADRVLLIEEGSVAMDTRIALDRPRERDSGFAHYEQIILNRVLGRNDAAYPVKERKLSYSI